MQRWEYLTLSTTKNYGTTKFFVNGEMQSALKNGNFNQIINQLGGQGWEMVGIGYDGAESTYIFKRVAPSTGGLKKAAAEAAEVAEPTPNGG
jgi:hypothetical protein